LLAAAVACSTSIAHADATSAAPEVKCPPKKRIVHRRHHARHVPRYAPQYVPPQYFVEAVPQMAAPGPCETFDEWLMQSAIAPQASLYLQPAALPPQPPFAGYSALPAYAPPAYGSMPVRIWFSYHGPDQKLKVYGLNDFNPGTPPALRSTQVARNGVFLTWAPAARFGFIEIPPGAAAMYRWIVICDVDYVMAWVGPRGLRYALAHGQAPCTVTLGSPQVSCAPGT
jgi:hypothetical protein